MILERNHILKERAQKLAHHKFEKAVCTGNCTNMINFILAKRSYCLDASYAKEILTIDSLVPVPGTHASIAGIYNLRGVILTVMHLNVILNIKLGEENPNHVLVLEDKESGTEFGILVDQIVNTLTLEDKEIQALPINQNANSRSILAGVSAKGHTILNTKQLIQNIYQNHSSNNS